MADELVQFYNNMNKFFDIIFHPIQTLQKASYSICLIAAGILIILGIIGIKDCYKYAGAVILLYVIINLL